MRKKFILVTALTLSSLTIILNSPIPAEPFAHRGSSGPGDYQFSLRQNLLRNRSYSLHVPPSYNKETYMPLVIAMHGGGGSGEGMRELTGWDQKADKEGFIVAYPDGTGRRFRGKTGGSWNGGRCCPPASEKKINDVDFIDKMIDQISRRFRVDLKRVYATGHSNGAIMSYRLACELSDKIAAIGPTGGQGVFDYCEPKQPVSILHIHGTDDWCARFEGGECGGCFEKYLSAISKLSITPYTWSCESVESHIQYWREKYQLPPTGRLTYTKGNAECETFGPGSRGEEVTLCAVKGMGHNYPGGALPLPCRDGFNLPKCQEFLKVNGPLSTDIQPTKILWDFFARHHR